MKITDACLKQIYVHAKNAYPRECFGFMVGLSDEGGWVRWVVPGTNLNTDRHDRFDMDPAEFLQVDRQAEDKGFEILGVYHSHPDWPAIPSQTDISSEVEGYLYLITSIYQGSPLNTMVWQIADDAPRRFVQLPLEIVDETIYTEDRQSWQKDYTVDQITKETNINKEQSPLSAVIDSP